MSAFSPFFINSVNLAIIIIIQNFFYLLLKVLNSSLCFFYDSKSITCLDFKFFNHVGTQKSKEKEGSSIERKDPSLSKDESKSQSSKLESNSTKYQ